MKPSVCLFTDSPEPSGVGEHMLTLAAELHERYRISFVCPPTTSALPLFKQAWTMGLETLALDVRLGGRAARRLQRWLDAQQIMVFHDHAGIGWEGHYAIHAARAAKVPAVVRTEHLPYLVLGRRQRVAYRRLLPVLDRLILVSEGARTTFRKANVPAAKLCVIRNGIQLRRAQSDRQNVRARLGLPPHARIVLTVARMTEQKGHRYLVEAARAVVERVPDAYFVWVGRGPLERILRARVHALGLSRRVRFAGRRRDVPELLAGSDVFVLPSLFEGLPLAPLEAMAAGLPVIGTRVCGTAEVIRDGITGRLVEAADAPALATALLEVLDQPDLAARWGRAGRERVEGEFSAARMARETAAIYDELLGLSVPTASQTQAVSQPLVYPAPDR